VVPAWPVQQVLIFLAKLLPKEKLVPQKDLAELAFKEEEKRKQVSTCHTADFFVTHIYISFLSIVFISPFSLHLAWNIVTTVKFMYILGRRKQKIHLILHL
jgi:hypothetical protein